MDESDCVTVAGWSPLFAEAALGNSSSGAYLTPIGFFSGLHENMDAKWTLLIFPYKYDKVVGNGRTVRDVIVGLQQGQSLKADDDDRHTRAPTCSCLNASLCKPLEHGPPALKDVHVWSDGGGPCLNKTDRHCKQRTGWKQFDLKVVTTLVMMSGGNSIKIGVDGAVSDQSTFSYNLSALLCTAHAHDTRVVVAVLPDLLSDPTKRFYEHLFGNVSAVQRMAEELTAVVSATGIDGLEFDFESMTREVQWQPDNKFEFGMHHVAAMAKVSQSLKAAQPHSTVGITIGAVDLTPPMKHCGQWSSICTYARFYPIDKLSRVVDQVFIMACEHPPRCYIRGIICSCHPGATSSALRAWLFLAAKLTIPICCGRRHVGKWYRGRPRVCRPQQPPACGQGEHHVIHRRRGRCQQVDPRDTLVRL